MKLSTRARYGVRIMVELALNYGRGPVFLKDISRRQSISEKYLSLIIIPLRGVGLVNSSRGAYGGYSLAKEPSQITMKEIVDVLEGNCSLVDCVKNPSACSRVPLCASHDIWAMVGNRISETLNSITLEMLVKINREKAEKTMMHNI
jgi:Rrf2 family protein